MHPMNGPIGKVLLWSCLCCVLRCDRGGQGVSAPSQASAKAEAEAVALLLAAEALALEADAALVVGTAELDAARAGENGSHSAREPDVIYVPTPALVVDQMLELAQVEEGDIVYDLGCGDGRIVIAAAERYGVRAWGFDIDPARVAEAKDNAKAAGVDHLVTIEERDIFTLDLSPASVVTLYLLPELNVRLIPQLERLKPGSRVFSHDFDMEGVTPRVHETLNLGARDTHQIFLWHTPLRAATPPAELEPQPEPEWPAPQPPPDLDAAPSTQ